ncbi:MAG TPA: DUF393 domain-containing protein [Planctomycetes bacterium]|nr:DUF393 domain-containing protein [Planctomycetota bacterium]
MNQASFRSRLTAYWFPSRASLVRLGGLRLILFALLIFDIFNYGQTVFADAARVSNGELPGPWRPVLFLELLHLGPPDLGTIRIVFAILLASACLGFAGLLTRLSCWVAAPLSAYWTAVAYAYTQPHHDKVAFSIALFALALGPSGARLSLDSLLARYRRARRGEDPLQVPKTDPFAMFPIRLIQWTLVIGYTAPGWSKLLIAGPQWMNGYTLMGIMMEHHGPLAPFFASRLWLCVLGSVLVFFVQTTFAAVLIWPKARWFYLPGALFFHTMTWLTMDTGPYITLWLVLCAFLPLERLPLVARLWWRRSRTMLRTLLHRTLLFLLFFALPAYVLWIFARILPLWVVLLIACPFVDSLVLFLRSSRWDLIYDGGCGICRRALAVLAASDWGMRLRVLDFRSSRAVSLRHPDLTYEEMDTDIHLVLPGNRVYRGFDAYRKLAWLIPLYSPLAPFLYLPGVASLGRKIYRHVADHRSRIGCGWDQAG